MGGDLCGSQKGSVGIGWRQFAIAISLLALGACSSAEDEDKRGTVGFVQGFLGGVAVDEPQAALVGRDILSAGGTAADAAVAMYFTMAVTLPSQAGLGGGGVCLAYDHKTGKTEMLDFLARAPHAAASRADRPNAIPMNARGFFALYSKYGRLRWGQLIAPAENVARFGVQVSRAFASDMARVGNALIADPESRRVFGRKEGSGPIVEGDFMTQVDLAATLARVRVQGPGDLYTGAMARQLVEAVGRAGGALTQKDLRDAIPVWRGTIQVPFGNLTAHFPLSPPPAGVLAAQMFAMLANDDMYGDGDAATRVHALSETAMRAYADRATWWKPTNVGPVDFDGFVAEARIEQLLAGYSASKHTPAASLASKPVSYPENPSATGFVALDRNGSAVSCAVTMNNVFGTGRIAPGTGILLAALPGQKGRGATALSPMLVVNENVNEFFLAAASSGGVTAPTSLMNVVAGTLLGELPLEEAIIAPRVHHGGQPDTTYYEKNLDPSLVKALAAKGHTLAATKALGRVNAVYCSNGAQPHPETCVVKTDPRGFGLAASAD